MADNKWIHDLNASASLPDAARHVLTVRLDVVRHYFPLAVHDWEADAEHVHQLRVATRRARAALDTFDLCLPRPSSKKARKRLRSIRRAAGAARDWDVFLIGLPSEASPRQRPGLDFVLGYAVGQRRVAQTQLQQLGDEPVFVDRLLADTVSAVQKPANRSLRTWGDWARVRMAELLQEFDGTSIGDHADTAQLHRLRITGKRLRYGLEIFAHCLPGAFREELYPRIETMQDILGQVNDAVIAAGHLSVLCEHMKAMRPADWKRFRTGAEWLLKSRRKASLREQKRFGEWSRACTKAGDPWKKML